MSSAYQQRTVCCPPYSLKFAILDYSIYGLLPINPNQICQDAIQTTIDLDFLNLLGNSFEYFQFLQTQRYGVILHHLSSIQHTASGSSFFTTADSVRLGCFSASTTLLKIVLISPGRIISFTPTESTSIP